MLYLYFKACRMLAASLQSIWQLAVSNLKGNATLHLRHVFIKRFVPTPRKGNKEERGSVPMRPIASSVPIACILLTLGKHLLDEGRREAISIERGDYLLPYDMRLTEAMGLLRYNPAKMIASFTEYYKDELHRKVGRCYSSVIYLLSENFCVMTPASFQETRAQ